MRKNYLNRILICISSILLPILTASAEETQSRYKAQYISFDISEVKYKEFSYAIDVSSNGNILLSTSPQLASGIQPSYYYKCMADTRKCTFIGQINQDKLPNLIPRYINASGNVIIWGRDTSGMFSTALIQNDGSVVEILRTTTSEEFIFPEGFNNAGDFYYIFSGKPFIRKNDGTIISVNNSSTKKNSCDETPNYLSDNFSGIARCYDLGISKQSLALLDKAMEKPEDKKSRKKLKDLEILNNKKYPYSILGPNLSDTGKQFSLIQDENLVQITPQGIPVVEKSSKFYWIQPNGNRKPVSTKECQVLQQNYSRRNDSVGVSAGYFPITCVKNDKTQDALITDNGIFILPEQFSQIDDPESHLRNIRSYGPTKGNAVFYKQVTVDETDEDHPVRDVKLISIVLSEQ